MTKINDETNKTTAMVYQKLRKRILDNSFPPNTRFNQNDLSVEFNISRTPVVKALHMLEMDGLVDNIPQRGFFIHQVSLREMMDLFMLRQAIEIISAANAAEITGPEHILKMEAFFAPFTDDKMSIDENAYYQKDCEFHDYLFSLCDNHLLSKFNESLQILTRTYLGGLLRSPLETISEHLQLIEAIRQHDIQRAQILAMQHIDVTRKQMKMSANQLTALGVDISSIPVKECTELVSGINSIRI